MSTTLLGSRPCSAVARDEHAREVSGHLVGSPAFKAGGTGDPRPAGSIPVHLRQPVGHRGATPAHGQKNRVRRCMSSCKGGPTRRPLKPESGPASHRAKTSAKSPAGVA